MGPATGRNLRLNPSKPGLAAVVNRPFRARPAANFVLPESPLCRQFQRGAGRGHVDVVEDTSTCRV
jgi:hypothetical protein